MATFHPPTPEQQTELTATMQCPECDKRYWKRLYSVKLNAQGYSLADISDLLEVHYNSVYQWIRRYEQEGVAGLRDRPIGGRPPLLSEADRQQVEVFIRDTPNQPKVVLARVEAELGKSISRDTLRRTLKALDHTYRRVKKSLQAKRNEGAFEVKKKNLKG
jgi:transposase